MYEGSLEPVSNREDWQFSMLLWDSEENEFIDISGCTVTITVRDQRNKSDVLLGSTTSGEITLPENGVFEVLFPAERMGALCAATYDVGLRIKNDDRTVQLVIGTVQVREGIDQQ